jgi:hypothetical protein
MTISINEKRKPEFSLGVKIPALRLHPQIGGNILNKSGYGRVIFHMAENIKIIKGGLKIWD